MNVCIIQINMGAFSKELNKWGLQFPDDDESSRRWISFRSLSTNVQFWKVTSCASSSSPFAGCILFVCLFVSVKVFVPGVSLQGLCKLPKHYHSRLHEFFIPDRSSLPPQPSQAGSSPNQGFLSSVRNSGKTTLFIRKHSSWYKNLLPPPQLPNAFHYLSIIRLELFTSLPLIIHFTACVVSVEGGTKAGLYSLQSPSHFWLVSCLANALGSSRPLPVSVLSLLICILSLGQSGGQGLVGWGWGGEGQPA